MGRLKQKGKAGAAKTYITRSSAVKKLQCSLADFRRLCILKGIFPREPRHKKRANKGSTAPTSFYYAKDIAYLAHEPVLNKLREHKAFAKKISRALGRGEWSTAKNLEDNKPVYRLDHIIKERYPSFIDAVRDIDDALCMIHLFASLPSNPRVSPALIENCVRLTAEWQLYVMHTRSLRNVFLSIKGVYYQAEIMDQNVTWLVPYQFPQNIPSDVDVRVMLTFLELYQTLLGFVFFKLYTDAGLVYPPPLDSGRDESGAGVGAFNLRPVNPATGGPTSDTPKVSSKEVRQTIKSITAESSSVLPNDVDIDRIDRTDSFHDAAEEEFVPQASKSDLDVPSSLPTLLSLSSLPKPSSTNIFAPYTFWLSRESSRSIFEFLIRSFGGRIGWPVSSGGGSPLTEDDEAITHVIIDRPTAKGDTAQEQERRRRRKYVQPQWVVDCINTGKILLEDLYAQGKTLPPHLSPFGERDGAYDPTIGLANVENSSIEVDDAELSEDSQEVEDVEMGSELEGDVKTMAALAVATADDPEALRAAELAAEAAGVDFGTFEKEVQKKQKQQKHKGDVVVNGGGEEDMNKILMSKRKRQLYERMKYGEKKRAAEHAKLEEKRTKIEKDRRRKARAS
ncbi:Pescadillo N-terminus-domain-containing protein [Suillus fuscotomentosus]|uniref:Pescadillo homolog n=1 Tax=Suillus fuscotomentosus TaxID=1912939 RepID=A0AAD4HFM8_9AGAM|nr:Pescadillo N-terminus-domain-containing protein [Suillus fuscotomentosus]KAG1894823.1 Pescadillo N-terminus-domain-containing protein [Suillus fuscotomentosus]